MSSFFIGSKNADMINNLTVDIVDNSFGKACIILSEQAFKDLKTAKKENYEYIYKNEKIEGQYNEIIKPMFNELYICCFLKVTRLLSIIRILKHNLFSLT